MLPLSRKPELTGPASELAAELRRLFMCDYDETQAIGRRYRRQDEIGTPYCVTYDFDSRGQRGDRARPGIPWNRSACRSTRWPTCSPRSSP
ncbi:MAG: His/Gly/Thr/Pro-type tRNA ligase C-terminal domain-containing protein [Microthrixaceae bacterium]